MPDQDQTKAFIYGLLDPDNGRVRYVGGTKDLERRNRQPAGKWLYSKGNSMKNRWVRSLVERGILPELVLLENTTLDKWVARRRDWIASFRRAGYNLLNSDKREACRNAALRGWTKRKSTEVTLVSTAV